MKKIISILSVICLCATISAQTFKAPAKNSNREAYTDTTTTYKYEMVDKTYDVYKSKKGALYIWKKSSKSGKLYKMYLPKEIQIKMGRKYDK